MAWYKTIFGDTSKKALKGLSSTVEEINALEPEISKLSDEELKAKTAEFKEWLAKDAAEQAEKDGIAKRLSAEDDYLNETEAAAISRPARRTGGVRVRNEKALDAILPEAFAVVREASRRTLGQRHFDVQLLGGMILHQGNIAEMRTGEGKTLVATLPAYLNALTGKGVQIVTVNDYLSRRDGVWMGQIYSKLGLSVGIINTDASYLYDPAHKQTPEQEQLGGFKVFHEFLRPCARKEAYAADITYGTNNEFGFDYLRDNIEYNPDKLCQREFNYAIVDEIDSILIDEARTPLIISAPTVESESLYDTFAKIADKLVPEEDYTVDEKFKTISLTDAGISKTEKSLGVDNIYTEKGIKYVHHLETAVRAKALYKKDKAYVVRDGMVLIVDEFTGRLQPGRRWSEGLHQAIEAKEGVMVQKESRTYASITFQNFFRLYNKLAGMTGTAETSKEEFFKVYGLDTIVVPTNKPAVRIDHDDLIFQTEAGKFKAIARRVKELVAKGQPVLIGTVSIEKNELLSEYLKREGVQHALLNAKPQHAEKEGETVAQAGKKGMVTLATNMAGRGVDIKLGGNPATPEVFEAVKSAGGLFVLGTERHEARRIDNQLRGRSGRQGDPGETQFYVSLDDSLMRIFASDTLRKMMGRFGIAEDEPVHNGLITRSLESAQTKIEGFNFDARKNVLEYDDILNLQRITVYGKRRKILLGDQVETEKLLSEVIDNADIPVIPEGAAGDDYAPAPVTDAVETGKADALRKIVDEKKKILGDKEFGNVIRRLFLQTIDMFWVDHLELMDYLRSSVRLRAYGQRDPLVEYKKEGLRLFKEMEMAVTNQIMTILPNIGAGAFAQEEKKMKDAEKQMKLARGESMGAGTSDNGSAMKSVTLGAVGATAPAAGTGGTLHVSNVQKNSVKISAATAENPYADQNIGRNDPCPCGSGKKYKKCHGQNS